MIRFLSALAVCTALSSVVSAADFVGSESCRSCHLEAYEQWRNGPHARAHLSLSTTQAKDPQCSQCHAPDAQAGGDPGVTCESCHGAGEYYSADYVMRDAELARATGLQVPAAADCLLCHDASSPSLQAFDAAKKLQEIDHWTKPREARKKNASSAPCELPTRRAVAQLSRDLRPGNKLAAHATRAPAAPAETRRDKAPKQTPAAKAGKSPAEKR